MILSYLAFAAIGIMWGCNYLYMKMAVAVLLPSQVAWLRVFFGAFPVLSLALARKALNPKDLKHFWKLLGLAMIANVLPFYFLVKGTQHLKSGVAGVMAGSIPLITLAISVIFLPSEKIGPRKVTGLIAGFVGVALVAQLQNALKVGHSDEIHGIVYLLIAGFFFAGTMVYTKKFLSPLKMSTLQLSAYQTCLAAVCMAVFTPFSGMEVLWSQPKLFAMVALGLGLLGTGVAYILFFQIIETLGPITASAVYFIPPPVALIVGAIFAGEMLTPLQFAGSGLILAGVYLARS